MRSTLCVINVITESQNIFMKLIDILKCTLHRNSFIFTPQINRIMQNFFCLLYTSNMLYKKTRLEDTFSVNMLAVCDGKPETLGLKEILEHHVDFQFELADRKYKNLLGRELEKKEIQEGLILSLIHIYAQSRKPIPYRQHRSDR